MRDGLRLQRDMLDAVALVQQRARLGQHGFPCRRSSTIRCAESIGLSGATLQMCRSCTDATPGTDAIARPISSGERCSGTPSISPCRASRSRRRLEVTISAPMTRDSSGSIGVQPVKVITTPAISAATEPEQVAHDMQQRGARVEVLLAAAQQPRHQDVDQQAERGGDGNCHARDGLRILKALHGGDGEPGHQHQQSQAVDERGDEFRAPEAVGMQSRCGARSDPRRRRGKRQGAGVADHVPGIGDQSERPRPQTDPGLHRGIAEGKQSRQRIRPARALWFGRGWAWAMARGQPAASR